MTDTDTSADNITQIEQLMLHVENGLSMPCLDSLNDEVTTLTAERDTDEQHLELNAQVINKLKKDFHKLQARAERAEGVLERQGEAWSNVLEFGIIAESHRTQAEVLRDEARSTLAQIDAEPDENSPTLADAYRAGRDAAADKCEREANTTPNGWTRTSFEATAKAIRALHVPPEFGGE